VNRVWLTGPRAGQRDVLADNLPGIPDNMSTGADGLLWIALASPRNRLLDWAHRRPPVLRRVVWALPEALQPPPAPTSWVIAVDGTGAVVHDLQRSEGGYQMVTGVRAHAGSLYLGSLTESAIAVLPLPS
jgi:sugar lactone lactonase YvrE